MEKRGNKKSIRLYSVILLPFLLFAGIWDMQVQSYRKIRETWLEQADRYAQIAQPEKSWILSCQTASGLILHHGWDKDTDGSEQTVIPYFSNIAAAGLLAGKPEKIHVDGARAYLLWYFSHLNTEQMDPSNGDGTIYDYRVIRHDDGSLTEESRGKYDSADSYAATFLIAAELYMRKGETATLLQHYQELERIMEALLRTIHPNGLSTVKEEFPVQYLMDNAEVYRGLLAAAALEERLRPDSQRTQILRETAAGVQNAVQEHLWDEQTGYYEIGLSDNGIPFRKNPGQKFYPDSTAQIFPIIFGVIPREEERSQKLYSDFCAEWNLAELGYREHDSARSYWCALAYAAAKMRDEPTLLQFVENYRTAVDAEDRAYPLYTGEAGWLALACGEMEQYYRTRLI